MANPLERPKTFRPLLVNGQPVVGFDLGTTFSKAAFIDTDHQPRLVPLGHSQSQGSDLFQMPSVAILRSDKLIVGDELPPIFDPDDIPIRLPKRFLADPRPRYPENKPRFSASEICAQILKRLKVRTELHLKVPVRQLVLTVPPSFGSRQRHSILQAAKWAELDVIDLVEEPVAAAVYDWMVERTAKPGATHPPLGVKYGDIRAGKANMLVFDLGGGTLDISLLHADGMKVQVMESWAGGEFLGGADFTQAIADWIAAEIRGRTGFDPVFHLNARDKVYQSAESMKLEMATAETSRRHWKDRNLMLELTADHYNRSVEPLLTRAQMAIYQAALSAEKQLFEPVKRLLIVGAGCRARGVREMIETLDSKRVGSREMPENGSFWVALGAAATAWLTLQNPGENALGPSDQNPKIFQLQRKSNLNLGIVAWDHAKSDYAMRVVIKSNSQLPAEKTVSFGKVKFNQPRIRLRVVESPTQNLLDSKIVGEFLVETEKGLDDHLELKFQSEVNRDQDPNRDDELKVTLAYDMTGRVRVTLLDRRTSKKISKTIEPEPVNSDSIEEQIANSPTPKPPATSTPDDEVKRMRRQILQLRADLKLASKPTSQKANLVDDLVDVESQPEIPSPTTERLKPPTVPVRDSNPSNNCPDLLDVKSQPEIPSPTPGRLKPPPVPVRDFNPSNNDPDQELELDLPLEDDSDILSNRPLQTFFDDDSIVLDALSGSHIAQAPSGFASNSMESLEPDDSMAINLGVTLRMNDPRLVGLNYSMKLILLELLKSETWTWDQFTAFCNSQQSQPKVVFERLNQWSESKYHNYLLTRDNENLNIRNSLLN